MAVQVDDKVPELLGIDQDDKEVEISNYKGRGVVLYFHPKDDTSGCTAEVRSLYGGYQALQAKSSEITGVSKDSARSHRGFIQKQSLPFRLIADTDTTLQKQFGMWAEKKMHGRSYIGTPRTTFTINEKGIATNIIGPGEVETRDRVNRTLNL